MLSSEAAESRSEALKVLHVAETLPGGIATYLRDLLPLHIADPAIGEIRVLAPQDQLTHLKVLPADMLYGYARSGRNVGSLWNLVVALRAQAAEFRPQIIHLHSSFAGVIGRLLRPWLPKGVRIVYCPHGWAFSRDDSRISRLAYIWAERCLASRANAWVAISQHELDAAVAVGIRADHAHLINNGVRDSQSVTVTAAPAFDSTYLNLLFVGRHDRQKGLDTLLSAMAQLLEKRVRLYIAGAGVVSRATKQENTDNIFWLGWLAEDELIAHYRACDAIVVPSRWEGFGLVAIEAMSASKAVIAARTGALSEIVDDGRTGRLVGAENSNELAQVLMETNREELTRWGAAGRKKYTEKYDVVRVSHELSMLYQDLLKA
ncbi:MAG: glycosyltransferase [Pseudomonadota bacterium]